MADEKYFNFPIQLLSGFLKNSRNTLTDMCNYAVYAHSLNLDFGENEEDNFKDSASYLGIEFTNVKAALSNGKKLYRQHTDCPMVGISVKMYWDYQSNEKDEFQKLCLLGFIALKSILGKKAYCKTTNKLLFARMAGLAKQCEFEELPEEFYKYIQTKHKVHYWAVKIKDEVFDWGLKSYSNKTNGFYITIKLTYKDLVFEAEKKREEYKKLLKKDEKLAAIQEAKNRLKRIPP